MVKPSPQRKLEITTPQEDNLRLAMSGEDCYTLTQEETARMYVEEGGIEIVYPTGNMTYIPREMVEKACSTRGI